jgi:hypothetical protein
MQQHSTEHARRVRILRRVIVVVTLGQVAAVAAYFAGLLPPAVGGTAVFVAVIAAGLPIAATGLWVIAAYQAPALSPQQASELDERRRRFVRRSGVYGFGLVWGVSVAVWMSWKEYHTGPAWVSAGKAVTMLVVCIPMGLLSGRLWGAAMWWAFSPPSRPKTSRSTDG